MIKLGTAWLFFVFFFLYLLLYVNPRIIHTCNGVFVSAWVRSSRTPEKTQKTESFHFPKLILETTPDYIRQVVVPPGGATRFAITLIMEASAFAVPGALLITACGWLLFVLIPLFSRQCGGSPLHIIRYLLPLWLFAACASYELNVLFWIVPLIVAFAAACLYQRQHHSYIAAAVAIALFWIVWYLCGWACLLFGALVVIHELFRRARALAIIGPTVGVCAAFYYYIESSIVPPGSAMNFRFLLEPPLPIALALAVILATVVLFHPTSMRFLLRSHADKMLLIKMPGLFRASLILLLTAMVMCWIVTDQVNRDTRIVSRTLYHILEKQWDRILSENYSAIYRNFPRENGNLQTFVTHAVCRAHYEKGGLGSLLFSRPQAQFSAEPLMLLDATLLYGFPNWIAALDLYTELGLVNCAEKAAGETVECMGPYDFLLYRRALLQAAKGNSDAAAVYSRKLAGMPLYRKQALSFLEKLEDSTKLAADGTILRLRTCMDTSDYFLFSAREETMLQCLLKSNPKNRMAYEYLIAYYLLTGRPGNAAEAISRAAERGFHTLPRHWQEALCITMSQDSAWAARAADLPIQPETMDRFDRFMQRYSVLENDPATAPRELQAEFGDSYFYFYTFEFTPGRGAKPDR